jgi:hypothetical protein
MQYGHYQREAKPPNVELGNLPAEIYQYPPSSNHRRFDWPRTLKPQAEYPFAALYNPAAPVTVDQWAPVTYRTRQWPVAKPWQNMPPVLLDPSIIVPPSTPAGLPRIFLSMDEVDTIRLKMEEASTIYLAMNETVTTLYLEMSE